MTVEREMPPQSCLTSSTVYFARLRSSVGLVSTCFSSSSIVLLCEKRLRFLSEDWARGTLELPALATWHLLCQLTWTSHLRKSDVCIISKADKDPTSSVEPLAKSGSQLPTPFRVQDWQFRTPTPSNREQSCRRRFSIAVTGSPLHY